MVSVYVTNSHDKFLNGVKGGIVKVNDLERIPELLSDSGWLDISVNNNNEQG